MYRSIITLLAITMLASLAACAATGSTDDIERSSSSYEYVTGKAWADMPHMVAQPNAVVEFEGLRSGTIHSTTANGMGEWELRLPGGAYEFRVINSEYLMDPPAGEHIDVLPTKLKLGNGKVYFLGYNPPQYPSGFVISLPITTTQVY